MKKPNVLKNQKGMAIIEVIPLIVIFLLFLSFGMGFWGAIHSATLHSIAARGYAFETFRSRSNLNYFRENRSGLTSPMYMGTKGFRFHGIQTDGDRGGSQGFVATTRNIAMGTIEPASAKATVQTHNQDVQAILDKSRNQKVEASPIWVMVGYGICLNADCGSQ